MHFEVECVWRRNMIIRDNETGTLWQHATGTALVGPLKGTQLTLLGGEMMLWRTWQAAYPQTVAAIETNPWRGLIPQKTITKMLEIATSHAKLPGKTPTDTRLDPHASIIGVTFNQISCAYPLQKLIQLKHVSQTVDGHSLILKYDDSSGAIKVCVDGNPAKFQQMRWSGWYEFYPATKLF